MSVSNLKALGLLSLITLTAGLVGCTSTNIKKEVELDPLGKDEVVTVYTEKAPTFGYEVICDAEVEITYALSSSSAELSDFKERAKRIARKCGANMAMVESLSGYGSDVTVKIKAIRKTSDEGRLVELSDKKLDQLITAVGVSHVGNIRRILEESQVSEDPEKRSPHDSDILNSLMRAAAEKGSDCPQKSIEFLAKNYGAHVDTFTDKQIKVRSMGISTRKVFVSTGRLLQCSSPYLSSSFEKSDNKVKGLLAINNEVTGLINSGFSHDSAITAYKNFATIYDRNKGLIAESCKSDETSKLCSAGDNLEKIRTVIKKSLKI